jgi:hypothetical protein
LFKLYLDKELLDEILCYWVDVARPFDLSAARTAAILALINWKVKDNPLVQGKKIKGWLITLQKIHRIISG